MKYDDTQGILYKTTPDPVTSLSLSRPCDWSCVRGYSQLCLTGHDVAILVEMIDRIVTYEAMKLERGKSTTGQVLDRSRRRTAWISTTFLIVHLSLLFTPMDFNIDNRFLLSG